MDAFTPTLDAAIVAGGNSRFPLMEADYFLLPRHDALSIGAEWQSEEVHHADLDTGSHVLSLAAHGDEGSGRATRLRGRLRPRAKKAGWNRDRRRRSEFA